MAINPYHRGAKWSSAYALERIALKRAAAEKRLAEIARTLSALEAEQSQLLNLVGQLDAARKGEEARVSARGTMRSRPLDGARSGEVEPSVEADEAPSASQPDSASLGSEAVVRSAAQAGQASSYDAERCLFVTSRGPVSGSTRPKRIDVTRPGFDDPLMRRAVKILETPGLLHEMVVAERSQVVVDVDSYEVPEAALGLPLADAYCDHIFSLDALKALTNPDTADAFLAKVIVDDPESERS